MSLPPHLALDDPEGAPHTPGQGVRIDVDVARRTDYDVHGDHDDEFALWRLTVEHSPVGMCLVGLDGTMQIPNRAFAEMIGYPEAVVRQLTFAEVSHPDDLETDLVLFDETLRGVRSSYRMVKRFVRADGAVMWGDLSVALMRTVDGRPLHFISQVLDVTSQRLDREQLAQAMDAVERERNLSQAILDSVDVGLVLVDNDGNLERVNRRQHDILALAYPDRSEPTEDDHGHFYAADSTTALTAAQLPVLRAVNGDEFDDERIWVGSDLVSRRALSVSARTVRDASGAPTGAALAFSDVTDLVQAVRAREVFESSVSHELRTPLTSVLGHLELLLDGDLPQDVAQQLEIVHRNASRLQYLVSDLLDPAARGVGTFALVRAPVDVAEVAREVVAAALPVATTAGVELAMGATPVVRATVDAHRVRQVLDNLVSNAIKYTDPGGRVELQLGADRTHAAMTVTDTGIGVDAEDVRRLCDPFFRTDVARERPTPGVGLGLGIASSIVTAHGGRLEIDSVPGRGSTFRVTLPLEPPPEPGDRTDPP